MSKRNLNKTNESNKTDSKNRNTHSNSRGRKSNSNKSSNTPKEDKLEVRARDINDSSYYYADPLLREQITNFSFNQYAGESFVISHEQDTTPGTFQQLSTGVPTIMRIELMPAAGATGSTTSDNYATDGVQRASLKNYVKLSASNAKTTNYQPQDITKLMLALSSIMEQLSFAQRILGSLNVFNQRNRDLPQMLVEMQGVQYSDLSAHYSDYLMKFNLIVTLFNKIPIPANVPIFRKSCQMFNNFYVDDTSPMAQIYMPCPDGYWIFDEVNDKLSYKTEFTATPGTSGYAWPATYSMGSLLYDIERQINSVLESATFNYIYSDILRLSDKEGMQLLIWQTVPFGYVAPMFYSDEFNLWVNNLTIAGRPNTAADTYTTAYNDVEMDVANNKVCYKPAITVSANQPELLDYILNFTVNNPDVESKIASTRLVSDLTAYYPTDSTHKLLSCSDHFVAEIAILGFGNNLERHVMRLTGGFRIIDIGTWSTGPIAFIDSNITKFKHAPRIYWTDWSTTQSKQTYFAGDLDFYTTVNPTYLRKMFDLEWLTYLTIG